MSLPPIQLPLSSTPGNSATPLHSLGNFALTAGLATAPLLYSSANPPDLSHQPPKEQEARQKAYTNSRVNQLFGLSLTGARAWEQGLQEQLQYKKSSPFPTSPFSAKSCAPLALYPTAYLMSCAAPSWFAANGALAGMTQFMTYSSTMQASHFLGKGIWHLSGNPLLKGVSSGGSTLYQALGGEDTIQERMDQLLESYPQATQTSLLGSSVLSQLAYAYSHSASVDTGSLCSGAVGAGIGVAQLAYRAFWLTQKEGLSALKRPRGLFNDAAYQESAQIRKISQTFFLRMKGGEQLKRGLQSTLSYLLPSTTAASLSSFSSWGVSNYLIHFLGTEKGLPTPLSISETQKVSKMPHAFTPSGTLLHQWISPFASWQIGEMLIEGAKMAGEGSWIGSAIQGAVHFDRHLKAVEAGRGLVHTAAYLTLHGVSGPSIAEKNQELKALLQQKKALQAKAGA